MWFYCHFTHKYRVLEIVSDENVALPTFPTIGLLRGALQMASKGLRIIDLNMFNGYQWSLRRRMLCDFRWPENNERKIAGDNKIIPGNSFGLISNLKFQKPKPSKNILRAKLENECARSRWRCYRSSENGNWLRGKCIWRFGYHARLRDRKVESLLLLLQWLCYSQIWLLLECKNMSLQSVRILV